jgi:hydroxyacylglutathione hydrolase
MFIKTVVADAFGTKCYLVGDTRGSECAIVDPGIRVAEKVDQVVNEYDLDPVAVILTHGHLDHTYSAPAICETYGVPAYIHRADMAFLADPFSGLGSFSPRFRAEVGPEWNWALPREVRFMDDGNHLELGLPMRIEHAPGHTPGSVLLSILEVADQEHCLVGDVVYAGTIGTTGMPGGDREQTLRSIRTRLLTKPDDTVLLTAHKADTTVGEERDVNPFFHQAMQLGL